MSDDSFQSTLKNVKESLRQFTKNYCNEFNVNLQAQIASVSQNLDQLDKTTKSHIQQSNTKLTDLQTCLDSRITYEQTRAELDAVKSQMTAFTTQALSTESTRLNNELNDSSERIA